MLSCRDLATRLASDYVDGRLSLAARLRVRLHLAACENCRRFIEQFARVRSLLQAAPPSAVADADAADDGMKDLAARLRAVARGENNSS